MTEVTNVILMRSKSHFILNYRFFLLVFGFWTLKVEAEVSGKEDLGAGRLLREAWAELLPQPCRLPAYTHPFLLRKCIWPPFMDEEMRLREIKRLAPNCSGILGVGG